jgi:hypothetical protein
MPVARSPPPAGLAGSLPWAGVKPVAVLRQKGDSGCWLLVLENHEGRATHPGARKLQTAKEPTTNNQKPPPPSQT